MQTLKDILLYLKKQDQVKSLKELADNLGYNYTYLSANAKSLDFITNDFLLNIYQCSNS